MVLMMWSAVAGAATVTVDRDTPLVLDLTGPETRYRIPLQDAAVPVASLVVRTADESVPLDRVLEEARAHGFGAEAQVLEVSGRDRSDLKFVFLADGRELPAVPESAPSSPVWCDPYEVCFKFVWDICWWEMPEGPDC